MRLIELTQGRVAVVDNGDFKWLSQWNWHYTRIGKTGYAIRTDCSESKQRKILMHVAIMKWHKHWKRGNVENK